MLVLFSFKEYRENKSTIEEPAKVYLDLSFPDKTYQEHLIVHEFGHMLGLGHKHRWSCFCSWIKDDIDEGKMKLYLERLFADWQRRDDQMGGGATPYDPDSMMHYW